MDDAEELDALRRDVRWLKDRAEVLDVVATHARGCDRHDVELLSSTYHDDGVDVHGTTVNAGPEYPAWANAVHAATSANHLHNITCLLYTSPSPRDGLLSRMPSSA